mgnify:CR=1 FL=1|jgi:hypothetical protein
MNQTMITALTLEEQGAILFSVAIFCLGSVIACALSLRTDALGKSLDCCCFTLIKLIYKKCCKCSDLNKQLKEHLKDDDDDE